MIKVCNYQLPKETPQLNYPKMELIAILFAVRIRANWCICSREH